MKLVKATTPMCPGCGAELGPQSDDDFSWLRCDECDEPVTDPDYGYYAPDVDGVVREIDRWPPTGANDSQILRITAGVLRRWRDRLRGEK